LILVGLFEIGWPVGLKMAQEDGSRIQGIAIAVFLWEPVVFYFGFHVWSPQQL
jgi:hypothetical protein